MNGKEIITEKSREQKYGNIINKKKKKKKNNLDKDSFDFKNKNFENKIKLSGNNIYINNYKPRNRNFVIIRNTRDILKYMPKENSKEDDNNYYSLLNDFEVKNKKGNTSYYLIYSEQNKYNEHNNSNTLKSQESSKLRLDKFIKSNKSKEYKHNINKFSLPFCVNNLRPKAFENINNLTEQNEQDYFYRNNHIDNTNQKKIFDFDYFKNYKRKIKQEESKNNEVIMIEEYNNDKGNPDIINNNEKVITSNNKNNKVSEENLENVDKDQNEEENMYSDKSSNISGNNENSRNIPIIIMPKNTTKNIDISEENKNNAESNEKEEEEDKDNKEEDKMEDNEDNNDGNNEEDNIENINSENKKTIESEEEKNDYEITDKISSEESESELYQRKDLSTHCIVNIIKMPKQTKRSNFRIIRQNLDKNRNKKEFNSKKINSQKNIESKIHINLKKSEESRKSSKKKKIKSIEFLREFED